MKHNLHPTPALLLGRKTIIAGEVYKIDALVWQGERYYFLHNARGGIALMPASTVETGLVRETERHSVKVFFDNGDHLTTTINGNIAEITDYYLGKTFNLGRDADKMTKAIRLQFLD